MQMNSNNAEELEACPECKSSWVSRYLTDEETRSNHFSKGTKFFSRLIAVYDRDKDRTVSFACPDCLTMWDRFTGTKLNGKATFLRSSHT